jgi:hypothetical protein
MWFEAFVVVGYTKKASDSIDFLPHPRKQTLQACIKV